MNRSTIKLLIVFSLSAIVAYFWWNQSNSAIKVHETPLQSKTEPTRSSSLEGNLMVTYNGVYHTPEDGANRAWGQWSQNREDQLTLENAAVSLFPDLSEFQKKDRRKTRIAKPDGTAIEVFSSYNKRTVLRHFNWMREHRIDGVLLKRFASNLEASTASQQSDKILSNIREAAKKHNRSYLLFYDLENLPESRTYLVREDWTHLTEIEKIIEDNNYQHHRNKPLVAISTRGFAQGPKSRESLFELVSFFKKKGCSILLQVPPGWRTSKASTEWMRIARHADVITLMSIGNYLTPEGATEFSEAVWAPDQLWCKENNIDYFPAIFPGLHYRNSSNVRSKNIPRNFGKFLWAQIDGVKRSKSSMFYVESFDGMHDGTAILKWDKNASLTPNFDGIAYEDLPSDYYLKLVLEGSRSFRVYLEK